MTPLTPTRRLTRPRALIPLHPTSRRTLGICGLHPRVHFQARPQVSALPPAGALVGSPPPAGALVNSPPPAAPPVSSPPPAAPLLRPPSPMSDIVAPPMATSLAHFAHAQHLQAQRQLLGHRAFTMPPPSPHPRHITQPLPCPQPLSCLRLARRLRNRGIGHLGPPMPQRLAAMGEPERQA
jgi:hypothetical protein